MVDVGHSLFIGDSESDIVAGNDFGIRTIYLNSSDKNLSTGKPDFIISDLSEVNDIIMKTL